MTFPVTVEFRDQRAKIYKPAKGFPFYRLAFKVAGKRRMMTFPSYGRAKAAADAKLRELHKGQQSSALTAKQAEDAIAVRDMLTAHQREANGSRISSRELVSEYLAAIKHLAKGFSLTEAVRKHAQMVGSVKPRTITEAVNEFIADRKAPAKPGKRARFSPVYARNVETWLTRFSESFPGHLVSDLTADFTKTYLAGFKELSEKSRNDRRTAVGMWLRWCGRQEYLEATQLQKLLNHDVMEMEVLPDHPIDFYCAKDLKLVLAASHGSLRAVSALVALGGARQEEALRLKWEDLHAKSGHIEISGERAKTRKRRLLEVGPVLNEWLAEFKGRVGPIWAGTPDSFIKASAKLRNAAGVRDKRNGLRHSFISYSYALRGEIITSALAGTSPQILHLHYRGLTTRAEAKRWFAVRPAKTNGSAKIIPMPVTKSAAR